jgi:hypothetical protein
MAAFPRLVQIPPRAPRPDLATVMLLIDTANFGTRFPRDIVNFSARHTLPTVPPSMPDAAPPAGFHREMIVLAATSSTSACRGTAVGTAVGAAAGRPSSSSAGLEARRYLLWAMSRNAAAAVALLPSTSIEEPRHAAVQP